MSYLFILYLSFKYKNKKYTYNINDIYELDKNGNFDEGLFEDDDESYSIQVSKSKIEKTI